MPRTSLRRLILLVQIAAVPRHEVFAQVPEEDEHAHRQQQLGHVVEMVRGDEVLAARRSTRIGTISVSTMANPEKIAPTTKNGGKIVECQPGTIV